MFAHKKVMIFGTFDMIHPGHINMIEQAKKYGDYLIVVIARDSTVEKVKGRLPRNSEQARLQSMINSNLADKVILGNIGDKFKVIADEQPDVIALGYDQKIIVEDLEKKVEESVQIVRLKPFKPEIYKTSLLLK
jgi:FAD synthetase